MIKVAPETEINEKLVTKIVGKFKASYLPRIEELERYYDVKNKILNRTMDTHKPNNRLAHGFARYISNMATSFFMGDGIRMDFDDDEYKDNIVAVLNRNNIDDTNFEISKEMSKTGTAFELLYMNEDAEICFKRFKARDFIPVYSTSVSEFLEFAIRIWSDTDLITGKTTEYAEVYTKTEIISYKKIGAEKKYKFVDRVPHKFHDVPVVVYWNNEEQKGDYEDVICQIDAYDKAQSDTANDFEYFTDAYLVLVGAAGFSDESGKEAKALKQERIMLLEEKGQAEWLIKNINDTAVENYKNRLYDNIFILSKLPALTDESFAGILSGVAIKYKLYGLKKIYKMKENKFIPVFCKKKLIIKKQTTHKPVLYKNLT